MPVINCGLQRAANKTASKVQFSVTNKLDPSIARGTGSPTFTRASKAYVPDFENRLVQVQDNSPSYPGLRAVSNLATYSDDLSNAVWTAYTPAATATADTITFTGSGNDYRYRQAVAAVKIGDVVRVTFQIMRGTKTAATVKFGGVTLDNATLQIPVLPTQYTTYCLKGTVTSAGNIDVGFENRVGSGADGVAGTYLVRNFQYENLTGATNQNPGEYIATTSAPVTKWFDYANPYTVDGNGVVTDSGVRTPVYTSQGYLSEPAGTNIFSNPLAPATQGIVVTAAQHTLSFYGTGSIVATGTASFTLNGTGATNRVTQTFTPTAGTLTLTLSGSVTSPQLETGAVATSPMLSSAATSTRAATALSYPVSGNLDVTKATIYIEAYVNSSDVSGLGTFVLFDTKTSGANNWINLQKVNAASNTWALYTGNNTGTTTTTSGTKALTTGVHKFIAVWGGASNPKVFIDGVLVATGADNNIPSVAGTNFGIGYNTTIANYEPNGYIKAVRIYNTALSDAECIRMTT